MCLDDFLRKILTKENQDRVTRLAQYLYMSNRVSYSTFLYIMSKPFY